MLHWLMTVSMSDLIVRMCINSFVNIGVNSVIFIFYLLADFDYLNFFFK